MEKTLTPFIALAMVTNSEIKPLESEESIRWYNDFDEEEQKNIKDEVFEVLTGQKYKSMLKLLSHEQLIKIVYDKINSFNI